MNQSSANPLVSIITPTLNQAGFIAETIESVLNQTYPNIEYLVVDGGSTDNTLDILKSYGNQIKWISEKDDGQPDAINKGFTMSSGRIMAWLNSDDVYIVDAVETAVRFFQENQNEYFFYGDVIAIDATGKIYGKRHHVHQTAFDELLYHSDPIVQPGSFWKRELWQEIGELRTDIHYVFDYEYWIRASQFYSLNYLSKAIAKERIYSQAKTYKGAMQRIQEIDEVTDEYGNTGFPDSFKNEAVAICLRNVFVNLLAGKFDEAMTLLKKIVSWKPNPIKSIFYLFIVMLPGNLLPHIWLWRSWLREQSSKS